MENAVSASGVQRNGYEVEVNWVNRAAAPPAVAPDETMVEVSKS